MDGPTNGPVYRHRQIGWPIIGILGVVLIALGCAATVVFLRAAHPTGDLMKGLFFTFVPGFVLGVAVLILFASLTVVIKEDLIEIRFGPGLIRKKFRFADIQECKSVRNSWLVGWGIRWFPGCWVFNVSGLDAVELLMKNGKRYRIGTDEPEALREVIQHKLTGDAH
ncbi:MAG: hypothetical protein DME18_08920 [Verrucomicrobia bacterium]|nr:MAG: hypothetical protein DME18_08920 [Verrucomicrobiota bacterium]